MTDLECVELAVYRLAEKYNKSMNKDDERIARMLDALATELGRARRTPPFPRSERGHE